MERFRTLSKEFVYYFLKKKPNLVLVHSHILYTHHERLHDEWLCDGQL